MKLSMSRATMHEEIKDLIRIRALAEARSRDRAKTIREQNTYARGFRVLSDLYEDLSKAEVTE